MPYRRLPNTDEARLRALHKAYQKAKELPPFELAFSSSSYQQIQSFLPLFEKTVKEHRLTYETQVKRGKEYKQVLVKARTYLSHFVQVMNMAIQRGELPPSTRLFYGLKENDNRTPDFSSDKVLLEWGEKIIKGEEERVRKGLTPVTNPTIAKVKIWYDKFYAAYHAHKTTKKNSARYLDELPEMRKKVDKIIAQTWDEIEAHFSSLKEEERRKKAEEYGVVYVFRKNEINRLHLPTDAIQTQLAL